MTAFNMILTAAPIFFLGMFEKDLSEDVIAKHPEVYRDHKVLKFTSLMRWIGYAIMHSIGSRSVFFFFF
jgi:magnesium-transporting ATPase (P-type)